MTDHLTAVRNYLSALKDPSSLRDDAAIADTEKALQDEQDPIERLQLQQALADLRSPSLEKVEDEFVVHAKAWADEVGIGAQAFAAEGVPAGVLRRAGFSVADGRRGGRGGGSGSRRRSSGSSTRVTVEQVIEAMPKGAFTVKVLQEISGASPAVVRKAIRMQQDAGELEELGPDPDHSGPGRAPTLYRRR